MGRNRLDQELSPYLRSHRFNPVDWYPWGEEALERARREDKPIFLSVGYSTCYWCHVMARESFSDDAVAEFMNQHFVNVMIDREERPDLDEIYMAATQLLTHQGGWPNTLFLTPDLKPWFCGTYFPPQDRGEQPGFVTVVTSMAESWKTRRGEAEEQGEELLRVMNLYLAERGEVAAEPPPAEVADQALEQLASIFDPEWGGFGTSSKFPTPANLLLLEDRADDPGAAHMLAHTLEHMARGGIYDQLAGGFHRYATDREWKVPHFEKLLSDNGLLLEIYAGHHERTGDPEAARVTAETAAFLDRDLGLPDGGFATALGDDTDSAHGDKGVYHAWTLDEIVAVLDDEDAGFLAPLLGFDRPPFFEGSHYVLHLPAPLAEQAERRRMSYENLLAQIRPLMQKLLAARERRGHVQLDDKVLTDWNGMAVAGLAEAGRVLGDEALVERAARCADFLLENLRPEGTLRHVWRAGTSKGDAYLADYVFLVRGLLALERASGDVRWHDAACELTLEQTERLGDPRGGFFTAAAAPDLVCRSKPVFDASLPSANAVAVLNLVELATRDEDPRCPPRGSQGERHWRGLAEASLKALDGAVAKGDGVRSLCLAVRRFHS